MADLDRSNGWEQITLPQDYTINPEYLENIQNAGKHPQNVVKSLHTVQTSDDRFQLFSEGIREPEVGNLIQAMAEALKSMPQKRLQQSTLFFDEYSVGKICEEVSIFLTQVSQGRIDRGEKGGRGENEHEALRTSFRKGLEVLRKNKVSMVHFIALMQEFGLTTNVGGTSLRDHLGGLREELESVLVLSAGMQRKAAALEGHPESFLHGDHLALNGGKKGGMGFFLPDGSEFDMKIVESEIGQRNLVVLKVALVAFMLSHSIPFANDVLRPRYLAAFGLDWKRMQQGGLSLIQATHGSPDVWTGGNWKHIANALLRIHMLRENDTDLAVPIAKHRQDITCIDESLGGIKASSSVTTAIGVFQASAAISKRRGLEKNQMKFLIAGAGGVTLELMKYALKQGYTADQFIAVDVDRRAENRFSEFISQGMKVLINPEGITEYLSREYLKTRGITNYIDNGPGNQLSVEHINEMEGTEVKSVVGAANSMLNQSRESESVKRMSELGIDSVPDVMVNAGGWLLAIVLQFLDVLFQNRIPSELKMRVTTALLSEIKDINAANLEASIQKADTEGSKSLYLAAQEIIVDRVRKTRDAFNEAEEMLRSGDISKIAQVFEKVHVGNILKNLLTKLGIVTEEIAEVSSDGDHTEIVGKVRVYNKAQLEAILTNAQQEYCMVPRDIRLS
jgi:hypothetical protein